MIGKPWFLPRDVRGATGLDRFDPDHFANGPMFARQAELPTRELVTTFGHGAHYCPAARFSIRAICLATKAILERFDLEPRFRDPQPRKRQIGGVARADRACRIRYRR